MPRSGRLLALCLSAWLAWGSASANVLEIQDRTVTVATLTDTTVTMSGRSELHITDPGDPIPGCVIHLNSPDSWLFFSSIRPFTANASFLGRIRVNGANASTSTNVRVVQYGVGTVVIPHGPSFTPLTIHSERRHAGSSLNLLLNTYYNNSQLGTLAGNVRSFRLKRGYMATMARNENGTGPSRVFIAQDDDLDVTEMPAELGSSIRFIRVFPWRWVSKKGWAGANSSGYPAMVDAMWYYNWNNNEDSFLNREYVPIRQTRWWPDYAITNAEQNVSSFLGFNEPDSPEQANMTVAQAIAEWPNLMRSGLRVGSPAPTDGGLSWLYQFMDEAKTLNYRVDFVAVHFYRGGQTADQLYTWLRDIHLRTGKPLWVTEWNNGANWTCCAPSSYTQQATIIKSFVEKMDDAPFVERYAIYNWLNGNREMIVNNALTVAGEVYRDHQSPIGFIDAPSQRHSNVYDEQVLQPNSVDQEMPYSSSTTWTTGIGQTLGAAQVIPLSQFRTRLNEAAANGFGGVVDFERGGLTPDGSGFNVVFDNGRKALDFTNRAANGGTYSISGLRSDRTTISGENSLGRSGNANFDLEIANPRGLIREEKVVAAGLTALGRNGVAGSNFFRFAAWYTNGSQNGSTSVRRQIDTSTGRGTADTFAGIAAPPGYWITRITLTSENGAYTSIDDLAFITTLDPEFLWAPDGSAGGPGPWDNAAISWTTGEANLAWTPGRTAAFTGTGGTVDVSAAVTGVKAMVFESTGYTLGGGGSLAFAPGAEIMLNTSNVVLATSLAGNSTVNILANASSNQLQLRGDNRNFTGTLTTRGQVQLRPYNSSSGAVTGHELGGAATTADFETGTQARWFNLSSSPTYPNAFRIAGNGISGGSSGVLNLDTSSARTVTFSGPVALTAAATVTTQNNGSFTFDGPLTGAFPLTLNISPTTTSRINGPANLSQIIKSGTGALAFGAAASLTADLVTLNAGSFQIAPTATLNLGGLVLNVGLALAVTSDLTLAFPVTGPGTITKSGSGTLTLAAANDFGPNASTFTLGSGTTNVGVLRLSHPQALGKHTTVALSSGQGGTSGLELAGGHRFSAALQTAGRSSATSTGYTLRNIAGDNTWNGAFTITSTGGNYAILSDSGLLTITGDITSTVASDLGSRSLQFAGAGDIHLSGQVRRAGAFAAQDLAVTQGGPGTLILAAGGDYSGPTQVNGGTLQIDGPLAASNVTVGSNGRLSGTGTLPTATLSGRLALTAGQTPLNITGALTLQSGATLEISGTPASSPLVLARYASRSGNFTSITGVPAGWRVDSDFDSGTALALVSASGFSDWAAANGIASEPFHADSDGDGLANGLEYAIAGLDPAAPDGFPGTYSDRTLSFLKRPAAVANGDVRYVIETSSTLAEGSWTPVLPEIDNDEVISHTLPADHERIFMRLAVTLAP